MPETTTTVIDPVCGMTIDRDGAIVVIHGGVSYHFCDVACADTFRDEPERWLEGATTIRWRMPTDGTGASR